MKPPIHSSSLQGLAVLVLAAVSGFAGAQPAHLTADLVSEPRVRSSLPRGMAVLDGKLFFSADHPLTGRELWLWDGLGEVRLVKDLCPGRCSSSPGPPVAFGNGLYYFVAAGDEALKQELYSTDGTPAGTRRVVKVGPPPRTRLVATSQGLFFVAWTAETGWELWKSDGTAAGTGPLVDLRPGPASLFPGDLTAVGDLLFFATHEVNHGPTLYRSDGSPAGTFQVTDAEPVADPYEYGGSFFHREGQLFFLAQEEDGCGLWRSDGTVGGTTKLVPLPDAGNPCRPSSGKMAATGDGVLIFNLYDASVGGVRISRSDGTAGGTFPLADFAADDDSLEEVNGRVFFSASVNGDWELWVTDGSVPGTHRVVDPATSSWPKSLTAFGDRLFFTALNKTTGRAVWVSDGTELGTQLVADIHPQPWSSMTGPGGEWDVVTFGDRVVLRADDTVHGDELWVTDGTTAGTMLAVDVDGNVGSSSDPTGLLTLEQPSKPEDELAFLAGSEVWLTVSGDPPTKVTEFHDEKLRLRDLTQIGDHVFWTQTGGELWAFEVSEQVPSKLADLDCNAPALLGELQGRLFFVAADWSAPQLHGLYESDGTATGTFRLADLPELTFVGPDMEDPCFPMPSVELAARLYIAAGGYFLVTDGTAEGTGEHFTDKYCIPPAKCFQELVRMGDGLFFTEARFTGEVRVWRGTGEANTGSLLASFLPMPGVWTTRPPEVRNLTMVSDRLFFVAETAENGAELWTSDGTPAGTRLVADIQPGSAGSTPRDLFAAGGKLYFSARTEAEGRELWVTDGTTGGTRRVADIQPGPGSSAPQDLTWIDGLLVFGADDGVHGLELWLSDGTGGGTCPLQDVQPGILPSDPRSFVAAGGNLFLNAGTLAEGFELWSLPRTALYEGGGPSCAHILFRDGFESGGLLAWSLAR